ncbi:MAG TPA: hypothetical protein VFX06_16115 [Stellaceae bacterium]|nr:hypothetical protein [Stellaceae bacterium]
MAGLIRASIAAAKTWVPGSIPGTGILAIAETCHLQPASLGRAPVFEPTLLYTAGSGMIAPLRHCRACVIDWLLGTAGCPLPGPSLAGREVECRNP